MAKANLSAIMKSNSAIEVSNLSVWYKNRDSMSKSIKMNLLRRIDSLESKNQVLFDVSFQVLPGEVVGLIGRNGSGKSTLLKVIAGLIIPTQGRVVSRGSMTSLIELGSGLNHDLTCFENIQLFSSLQGIIDRKLVQEKALRICEWAGVSSYMDKPLRVMSSGMIARFAFSFATDARPEILLLDEILSVGDLDFQQKSFERTKELMKGGASVILVSHSSETIENFCSKVIWLERGKIKKIGNPSIILSEYINSFEM